LTLISSGLVGVRGLHAVAVLGLVLLASACREDDAETGADSTAGGMAQELFQQLGAGEARIEIAGIVETTGTRDTLAGAFSKVPKLTTSSRTPPSAIATASLPFEKGDVPGNVETLKKGWRCFP